MTRHLSLAVWLLAAGAALPNGLVAQEPEPVPPKEILADSLPPSGYPWLLSYFPYVAGGLGGGPVAIMRVRYFQPAPYSERQTFRAEGSIEAGIGLHGSRLIEFGYRAPLMSTSVRLEIGAGARRNTRESFFGLGNDTEYDQAVRDADEFAYRVHRTEYSGFIGVTRRIKGPLKVSILGGAQRDNYYELSSTSVFGTTVGSELSENDAYGRVALVLDTRDNEFDPTGGLLVEGGVQRGTGGDGYTRIYGVARAWRQFGRSQGAVRFGAADLYDAPNLAARFELPAWEEEIRVYGGSGTNRGLRGSRFAGTGLIFGNIELRREVLTTKNALAVAVVGFVDAGRVFEGERIRFTTDGLHVSPGVGLAVRILRSTTVIVNAAHGEDGMRFSIAGGWQY